MYGESFHTLNMIIYYSKYVHIPKLIYILSIFPIKVCVGLKKLDKIILKFI